YPKFGDTRLHIGFLLALAAAVFVWWLLSRSTIGFELRAVGANPDASRTAGMSVGRAYVIAMLFAGALGGLAATPHAPRTAGMSCGRAYVIAMLFAGALAGLAGTQQVLGTDLPLTDGVAAT